MEKFIPFEKLSKKKQRELNARKRGSWYGLNPVTRKPESSRAYNRRKTRNWSEDSTSVSFFLPLRGWGPKDGLLSPAPSPAGGASSAEAEDLFQKKPFSTEKALYNRETELYNMEPVSLDKLRKRRIPSGSMT